MSESTEASMPRTRDADVSVTPSPSFPILRNKYSDLFELFSPELFDGFEEFVKESRGQSAFGREPPPWW